MYNLQSNIASETCVLPVSAARLGRSQDRESKRAEFQPLSWGLLLPPPVGLPRGGGGKEKGHRERKT